MPEYTTNVTKGETFHAKNITEAMRKVLEWNGLYVSKVEKEVKQ